MAKVVVCSDAAGRDYLASKAFEVVPDQGSHCPGRIKMPLQPPYWLTTFTRSSRRAESNRF